MADLYADSHQPIMTPEDTERRLRIVSRKQNEPDAVVSEALRNAARGIGVALLLASIVLIARRWRRATPPWRRAVAPVLWWGAAVAATGALRLGHDGLGRPLGQVIELVFFAVLATMPLGFELGLLRSRLARGAVAGLVVELGQTRAPGKLRDALARALHDPSLALAYWLLPLELAVQAGSA